MVPHHGQSRGVTARLLLLLARSVSCKISGVMLVCAQALPGLRAETRAEEQVPCSISARGQNTDLGDNLAHLGGRSIFCLMRKKYSFPLTGLGTWRGHERSWALPGLMLAMDGDNHTCFPPDIVYFCVVARSTRCHGVLRAV